MNVVEALSNGLVWNKQIILSFNAERWPFLSIVLQCREVTFSQYCPSMQRSDLFSVLSFNAERWPFLSLCPSMQRSDLFSVLSFNAERWPFLSYCPSMQRGDLFSVLSFNAERWPFLRGCTCISTEGDQYCLRGRVCVLYKEIVLLTSQRVHYQKFYCLL